MAAITAAMVKELRERTGAGIVDCKNALGETDGDLDKAAEYLRKKGLASAAKKAGRIATEGTVASYIHGGGRIGVLVEVNCESDFVARTEEFRTLVKELCMQIAASAPLWVQREDVPAEDIAKEREIREAQAAQSGKPPAVVSKMVDGQISKWMKEIALYEQPWVRDPAKDVATLIQEHIGRLGENIRVRRFVRYELGEGLEKKKSDLVAEVQKEIEGA
jgi:elongation factor Ts